jgi:hypothetical protein
VRGKETVGREKGRGDRKVRGKETVGREKGRGYRVIERKGNNR